MDYEKTGVSDICGYGTLTKCIFLKYGTLSIFTVTEIYLKLWLKDLSTFSFNSFPFGN
jgi:hypothetical protein